jgi:hypothetical protein
VSKFAIELSRDALQDRRDTQLDTAIKVGKIGMATNLGRESRL